MFSSTKIMQALSPAAAVPSGYQISRSLRFNSADSARLTRTNSVTGNQKIVTYSFWIKRTKLGTNQVVLSTISGSGAVPRSSIGFTSSDTFDVSFNQTGSAWIDLITTQVFRDVSSWYHIVIAIDTTQATSSNRVKLYINGTQVTAFGTAQYPNQNVDLPINWTYAQYLGSYTDGTQYIDSYLTEYYFIDGQALTPSSFGETDANTGVWSPKAYTGTYGTNGFYLNFSDNSGTTATTLGKDSSGNGNNWTPNNFSVTAGVGNDSLVDSPTNYGTDTGAGGEVRGNYATLNPLNKGSNVTLVNGNLDWSVPANAASGICAISTIGMSSGKWYCESTNNSGQFPMIGLAASVPSGFMGSTSDSYGYYSTGTKFNNGTSSAYGASYTSTDVIGIAFDADAGTLTFYKNGISQGVAFSGIAAGTYFFGVGNAGTSITSSVFNFGQRPFAYTAPSGFKALCTTNLSTPAIVKSNTNFDVSLYTGNGTSQNITNAGGFSPDWVWVKSRSNAYSNYTADILRGVNSILATNSTNAEATVASSITAFNSNGFSVGTEASTNGNGATFVAWQWDAGSSTVTNTSGSISSQVRANTTAGISVVTWTGNNTNGATVGHGLSSAPKLVIVKNRSIAIDWPTYHASLTAGYTVWINLTSQQFSITTSTNNGGVGSVSSTTFTCTNGTVNGNAVNGSGNSMVAYCFAEVEGFSKFGKYTGNGSADGPFVYCGFRPKFVMLKSSSNSLVSWWILDSARNTYNVTNSGLFPNLSNAENSTINAADFLSNGFKLRSADNEVNQSSGTYIFAAFAEAPFNYSRAR